MTARVDTQAAKERAEARRRLAKWSAPAEASRMGKSGYAPRKGQLAEWVVETCDDVLALAGLLADAEKALRAADELANSYGRQHVRDDKFYAYADARICPTCGDPASEGFNNGRRECSDAVHHLAAFDAAGGAGT